LIKRAILGVLGLILGSNLAFGACDPTTPPTYTTNTGLAKPAINSCGWGNVTNANWDIIDSSLGVNSSLFATLHGTQTFTGTDTFRYITVGNVRSNLQGGSVSIGNGALTSMVTSGYLGRSNVAIGLDSLDSFTDGGNTNSNGGVVAVGNGALLNSTGTANVGIGDFSGGFLTYGNGNNFIGYNSGTGQGGGRSGTDQVYFGELSGPDGSASLTNAGCIGSGCVVNSSNSFVLGCLGGSLNPNHSTCVGGGGGPEQTWNVGIGTDTPKERLHIVGNIRVDAGTVTATNIVATGLSSGQCVQSDATGKLTSSGAACGSGGGGGSGSSALQITSSGLQITSPTASINFYSSDFSLGAIGSTSTVSLNPATTDFIHNQKTQQTGANANIQYNITAGSGTFGSSTLSNYTGSYVTVLATNSALGLSVTGNGEAGGAVQDDSSGLVNIKQLNVGDALVIVSSYSDAQVGTSDILILDRSINRNDPLIRIIRSSNNSAPDFRVDAPAPNMEQIATSTDNVHGRGKFEPYATPYQSEILQVNSRAWDNTTFENMAYWEPLSIQPSWATPGLFLRAQDLTNDSGVLASSNTSGVNFFTQNNHTVGLTGPLNATASWRFRLPATFNNTGKLIYQSDNGDTFGDRTWSFLDSMAVTATSVTVVGSGGMAVTTPGDGIISLSIGQATYTSTYTVISDSMVPVTVGQCAVFSSTSGTVIGGTCGSGGGGSTTPGGNAYDVQYTSANGTQFAGSDNLQNNGSTVTLSGVYSVLYTNVSSETASGVNFDYTGSTITASSGTITLATFTSVVVSTSTYNGVTAASLGANAPNGTLKYCSDCTVTTPATCVGVISAACVCTGSGNGAFAKRLNGSWYCN